MFKQTQIPQVYDVDTHIRASAETIEPYLSQRVRQLIPELDQYRKPRDNYGYETFKEARTSYVFQSARQGWIADPPRYLGEAGPRENTRFRKSNYQGKAYPTEGCEDWSAEARLKDMDHEGIGVALMVPRAFKGSGITEVDIAFLQANHRHLNDYCQHAPGRLKALIVADADFIEASVTEIETWGNSRWAVGVILNLPLNYPLDHPDLHPIWQAAQKKNLTIVHHSFSTGYPGYRDLWANPFLGRSASHPWGAMRAIGAFMGSGLMDQFPELRFSILESGFSWLPFWAKRLDNQRDYMGFTAEHLHFSFSEYLTSGRFFAGIVLHEGGDMVQMVSQYLSEDVLMFSTDYPHPETLFPDSVKTVKNWKLAPDLESKILWENALRCFGEP